MGHSLDAPEGGCDLVNDGATVRGSVEGGRSGGVRSSDYIAGGVFEAAEQ